ncbi:phosphatase PAP2 family protein [Sphingomonas oryzagri]
MEQLPFETFEASTAATARAPHRRAFDPGMVPVYAGLGACWVILLVAMPMAHMSLDIALTAVFLLICGIFVGGAACLRLRGHERIAAGIECWTLLNVVSLTAVLGTYLVMRHPFGPIADHWMVAADRIILPGLNWRDTVVAVAHSPILAACANWVYGSLRWQGSMLIIIFCLTRQTDRAATFVQRWLLTLAIITILFAFLPCYGPATDFGLTHAEVPAIHSNAGWCAPPIMKWLGSAPSVRVDLSALDGIVTFPSFHAASATLFAWGFWSIRWARWPMLALNIGMILASVPIGGHYFIDVVAGTLIALFATQLPKWIARTYSAHFSPLRRLSFGVAAPFARA